MSDLLPPGDQRLMRLEIYRIVSSKALDGDSGQNPLGERRQVVEISKSQDPETKQGCC